MFVSVPELAFTTKLPEIVELMKTVAKPESFVVEEEELSIPKLVEKLTEVLLRGSVPFMRRPVNNTVSPTCAEVSLAENSSVTAITGVVNKNNRSRMLANFADIFM
ncbi:hypothetical protein [Methanococcoides burtonii]|uniref:hypothetical protein n=1 Tax=Methanococcoides burtonii TaxID=29291 RepID=UPI0000398F7A|nr:hypothetical protein [Methanococcoides burtonii]